MKLDTLFKGMPILDDLSTLEHKALILFSRFVSCFHSVSYHCRQIIARPFVFEKPHFKVGCFIVGNKTFYYHEFSILACWKVQRRNRTLTKKLRVDEDLCAHVTEGMDVGRLTARQ